METFVFLLGFLFVVESESSRKSAEKEPSRGLASVISAPAEPIATDKSKYTLFNPTPTEYFRDFNSDNGGVTNGPYTLDAGHFQLESEIFNYHKFDGEEKLVLNNFIFKIGLTNSVDFEFGYVNYIYQNVRDATSTTTNSGLGDFLLLTKINFMGNDGGLLGVGIEPFIKFPTNTGGVGNNKIEGGVFLLTNFFVTPDISFAVMPIWYYNKNSSDDQMHSEGGFAICLSPKLWGNFGSWVEYIWMASTEPGAGLSDQISVGMSYQFTSDLNVDWGTFIQFAQTGTNFTPFLGLSVRK